MKMTVDAPIPDLILLGAGHAHLEILRRFAASRLTGARITLISREPHSPYAGMLAGLIRGEHDFDAAHIDLRALSRAAGARLIVATATGLDLRNREISLTGRPALPFDVLSVNIGGGSVLPDGTGTQVKPIGQLLARLAEIEPLLHPGARLAVIGAGVGGTELALALARRLSGQVRIALICADAMPVMDAPARARAALRDALVDAGVELISGVQAGAFQDGQLALSDGSSLDSVAALWTVSAGTAPFLAASGLGCDAAGAIHVDGGFRSITHPFVFAAGDCASFYDPTNRDPANGAKFSEKSATSAMRAAPRLAANLRRIAALRPPKAVPPAFARFQPGWLAGASPIVLALGNGQAIGWRGGLSHAGPSVLRWKLRADRAVMARHRLPPFQPAAPTMWHAEQPPMAAATLARVMAELPRIAPARLPSGASVIQAASRQTFFLDDPFIFGQIAAVAALAAVPVQGARPWTAIGSVSWPQAAGHASNDLTTMLHGAASILAAEGCALTALQPEPGSTLSLGLAVNFLMDPNQAIGGQAMWAADIRAGDALIVTKPLGSGIVLEADRRGLAKARWLFATLAAMRRPNGKAATILRGHGAICWAGIGAGGLSGALQSLLDPADLTTALNPDNLPTLPGARELAAMGIVAPDAADNASALPGGDPLTAALLADPQLCGGLLAAVPESHAEACLIALRQAGHAGNIIGHARSTRTARPEPDFADVPKFADGDVDPVPAEVWPAWEEPEPALVIAGR